MPTEGTLVKLSDTVAEQAMEKVTLLLADRVADGVVDALMKAGFDRQFADALLRALERETEKGGPSAKGPARKA